MKDLFLMNLGVSLAFLPMTSTLLHIPVLTHLTAVKVMQSHVSELVACLPWSTWKYTNTLLVKSPGYIIKEIPLLPGSKT